MIAGNTAECNAPAGRPGAGGAGRRAGGYNSPMNSVTQAETDITMRRTDGTSGGKLAVLAWSHFLNDGAAFYLPGILPAVLAALHQPLTMIGVITAAMYVGQALQPVTGILADHAGGRRFVLGGLLACSLAGAMVGLAGNVWMLIALLLISGLGSTVFHPQALAAVRSVTQKRPAMGMATFLVGGELGRGAWPLITSLIVVRMGLHALWIIALPTLASIPVLLWQIPRLAPRHAAAGKIRWREHRRPFAVLVGFSAFRGLVVFGSIVFIPIMWKLRGGGLVTGASIISTLLITGVLGQLGGGTLADRFGRRHVVLGSSMMLIVLVPLLVLVHGALLWVVAGITGIAMFSTFASTLLVGQDIFPENRGLGSGIALGFSNALGAMGLIPLGVVLRHSNIYVVFAILTAGAAGMLATALLFSRKVHPAMQ